MTTLNEINLSQIKITPRDRQVLRLLVQGCSNKEIATQLEISPRTVKQHLRTLFLRAGIKDGRKRVRLATAMFQKEQMKSCPLGPIDKPGSPRRATGLARPDQSRYCRAHGYH
jgi:DNA-binding transcriptional ArsR family regulator